MADVAENEANQNQNHSNHPINDSPQPSEPEQIFVLKFAHSAETSSQFTKIPFLFRFVDEAITISPAILAGLRGVNLFPDFLQLVLPQFMAHREQIRQLIARYDESLRQRKRELVTQKLAEAALTHGDIAQKVLVKLAVDHYETFQLGFNSVQILGENARALESIAVLLAEAFITHLTYVTESFPRSLYESFEWQNDSSFKSLWRSIRWVIGSCDLYDFDHHKILLFDFYTKCVPIYRIGNYLWVKKEEIEEVTRMLKGRQAVRDGNYSFELIRRPFSDELGVVRRRRGEMDFELIFINVTDAILAGGTPLNYFGPNETLSNSSGAAGGNDASPPRPGGRGTRPRSDSHDEDEDSGNDDDDQSGEANGNAALQPRNGGAAGGAAGGASLGRAEAIEAYTQAICNDQDKILRQHLQNLKGITDKILRDCHKFPEELPADFKTFFIKVLTRNQIINETDIKSALLSLEKMTRQELMPASTDHDLTLDEEGDKKLDHHLRRLHAHKGTIYPNTVKKVKKIQAQIHHELSTEWVKTISNDLIEFASKIMDHKARAEALKILNELIEKELGAGHPKWTPTAYSILKFALENSLDDETAKPEWWKENGGQLKGKKEPVKSVPNFDEGKCSFAPHPDLEKLKEILEEIAKENNLTVKANQNEKPPQKLPSPSMDLWLKLWSVFGILDPKLGF